MEETSVMFTRDELTLEFFYAAVGQIEKELKTRFFHKLPEYEFMKEFSMVHDSTYETVLHIRINNKETNEHFSDTIGDSSLHQIPHSYERLKFLPRKDVDAVFDIFYVAIQKLMNKAKESWETMYTLDQCYVDRQNAVKSLVERKNYIMSCGYSPIGSIRETETGSSTDGNSTNHTETEVSEKGWFHDAYETVITGTSFSSNTQKHYKYWQEYVLEGN